MGFSRYQTPVSLAVQRAGCIFNWALVKRAGVSTPVGKGWTTLRATISCYNRLIIPYTDFGHLKVTRPIFRITAWGRNHGRPKIVGSRRTYPMTAHDTSVGPSGPRASPLPKFRPHQNPISSVKSRSTPFTWARF
ncbi:hypothetical protein BOTBODRAFT_207326 [Botryobasidium botryosum FD-172 SS1]|uniref:Uncharacterized protein n=1 Tax=Botryobasidium botryosum (strain FD-172 SS1) TaxID=930990 RepID=A0A067N123_BOTB1|nr:hypothetical protein BOTBODRAFT_207326 [Botryobasidium botryosum FD-172 SS1]